MHLIGARKERSAIDIPAQRRMRDAEIGEDVVVKALFADQQFMHACQKGSRLSALNDAMVVRAADRNRFTDPELRKNRGDHRLIFRWILNRAGGDDHRLAGHQSRRGRDRADRARISERNGCALEVRNFQLAGSRAFDDIVVSGEKFREGELICALDIRNQQGTRPILLFEIDCYSKIDCVAFDAHGLLIDHIKSVIHLWKLIERAQGGISNQVRI